MAFPKEKILPSFSKGGPFQVRLHETGPRSYPLPWCPKDPHSYDVESNYFFVVFASTSMKFSKSLDRLDWYKKLANIIN